MEYSWSMKEMSDWIIEHSYPATYEFNCDGLSDLYTTGSVLAWRMPAGKYLVQIRIGSHCRVRQSLLSNITKDIAQGIFIEEGKAYYMLNALKNINWRTLEVSLITKIYDLLDKENLLEEFKDRHKIGYYTWGP